MIVDINECLLSGDVCVDTALRCEDDIPGYSCICRTGAQGDGKVNGTGCTDVNECTYVFVSVLIVLNKEASFFCVSYIFYLIWDYMY
mgnify:CR=1 FL=1